MKINPNFKKVALQAVKAAGKIVEKNFLKNHRVRFKKDLSLVTDVDLEAEKIIRTIIKKNFPSHSIVSEESGGEFGKDFTWVVDPLDDTTNYVLGFPFFSVALALVKGEEPLLGVVFNPISGELYVAEKGGGAYLNKKIIKTKASDNISKHFLIFNKGKDLIGGLKVLMKIAPQLERVRIWGSGHLEICQVARGRVEGYVTAKPACHDTIASVLIAKEAGAEATDFNGNQFTIHSENLIVARKKIHNQLLKLIKIK